MSRKAIGLLAALAFLIGFGGVPVAAHDGMVPVFEPLLIGASGKYHLTANITAPGPVIGIAAPDVDLDLNGFTITETTGGAPAIAVFPGGADHVVVHNGTLAGGSEGIDVPVGPPSLRKIVLEDLKIHDQTGAGIHLGEVGSAVIRRCEISSAGTDGILWDGGIPDKTGTIENNVIRDCPRGIFIGGCTSVAILSNRIEGEPPPGSGNGIELAGCSACLLVDNTIAQAGADGIFFRNVQKSKIYDNVIRLANCNGIHLDPATRDVLVLNNVVAGNGFLAGACPAGQPAGDGILCEGDFNFFERNLINSNARFGLHLSGAGSAPANPGLSCGNQYGGNQTVANTGPPAGPCGATAPVALIPDFCNNNVAPACLPVNLSSTLNGKPGVGLY